MSFLEMLAIELKSEGLYVARGLSFAAAEFTELRCDLTSAQVCFLGGGREECDLKSAHVCIGDGGRKCLGLGRVWGGGE